MSWPAPPMLPLQVIGFSADVDAAVAGEGDAAADRRGRVGVLSVVPIAPPFNVIPVPAAPRLASVVKRRMPPVTVVPPE